MTRTCTTINVGTPGHLSATCQSVTEAAQIQQSKSSVKVTNTIINTQPVNFAR
jgi:hypothetical protein